MAKTNKTQIAEKDVQALVAPSAQEVDLFGSAPVVKLKEEVKKGSSANVMMDNVEAICAIDYISDALAGFRSLLETKIKSAAVSSFVKKGMEILHRPDNQKGEQGRGITGLIFSKRGSNRNLTEKEVEILRSHEIEPKKVEIPAVEDRFFFNPKLIESPEYRSKINAALASVDFGGEQVIIKQQGTPASCKFVVEEDIIDKIFTLKNEEDIKNLLGMLTTLSLKNNFNGNLQEALDITAKAGLALQAEVEKGKKVSKK